jgi:hypothetical protein
LERIARHERQHEGGKNAALEQAAEYLRDAHSETKIPEPKSGSLTLANRATAGGNWPNGNDKWENFGSPIG